MQTEPSSNIIAGKPAHGRNALLVQCILNTSALLDNLQTLYSLIFTTWHLNPSSSSIQMALGKQCLNLSEAVYSYLEISVSLISL